MVFIPPYLDAHSALSPPPTPTPSATTLTAMLVEDADNGRGSGSALNPIILTSAGLSALLATALASMSIVLQLKNYRKPGLQR
jgi:hypothetical protein